MELTIKVDIPALDRLAAVLEARNLFRAAREPQTAPVQAAPEPVTVHWAVGVRCPP